MEQQQYQTSMDTDLTDITDNAEAGLAACMDYV